METIQLWRSALAGAIINGAHQPADLAPLPIEGSEARATLRRLCEHLERDQAPLPPGAREVLGLAEGATFADAVWALGAKWRLRDERDGSR